MALIARPIPCVLRKMLSRNSKQCFIGCNAFLRSISISMIFELSKKQAFFVLFREALMKH